jgi:RNA polymerase primary sigma factor
MRTPKGALPELAPLYGMPLLSKEQEQHLFRKMNYLKYKAARLINELQRDASDESEVEPTTVRLQKQRAIEALLAQANQVKGMLINANMRLVVNFVKRYTDPTHTFFELLSDGNLSLLRAVEKFDWSRNFKFCTYATRAILTHFARTIPGEKHLRERFVTGHEEVLEGTADNRSVEQDVLASLERATHSVNWLLNCLDPREREIIRMRAGLNDRLRGMTLEEIGRHFGITKERVRQLNAQAMKKLRTIAEEQHFDP